MKKKALFAVSSLGLGHATRTLTIINYFLKQGYSIDIITYSGALEYLKKELEGEKVGYIERKEYPPIERGHGIFYYIYIPFDAIRISFLVKLERMFLKKIENNYDFIFSDGKYGFYSKKIHSYILSHQLSFYLPNYLSVFQGIADFYNIKIFNKFDKVFIPDYEDYKDSLTGKLSHPTRLNKINYSFVGILSNFYNKSKYENIESVEKTNYLFTITGYLKERKQQFLEKMIKISTKLDGKKIFILGDYKFSKKCKIKNTKFYSCVFGEKKYKIFNNSEIIISRAGYTTIMDILELNKKAILFPTKGQTEQEYLAKYLANRNIFVIGKQGDNLKKLIKRTENIKENGFKTKTKEALEKIFLEINSDFKG